MTISFIFGLGAAGALEVWARTVTADTADSKITKHKHRTSNIQHPTSKERSQREALGVRGWMLGVGCFPIPVTLIISFFIFFLFWFSNVLILFGQGGPSSVALAALDAGFDECNAGPAVLDVRVFAAVAGKFFTGLPFAHVSFEAAMQPRKGVVKPFG